VDIVVKGRHVDVSERFRAHVADKLTKAERLDPSLQRVDVEVSKEANPRLADRAFVVELTCRGRGPVIRAEAASDDKYAALDVAFGRLEGRLRRAADRRADHKNKHSEPTTVVVPDEVVVVTGPPDVADVDPDTEGPLLVREKVHPAQPMTLDQALYEMELVGHDFYLFVDSVTESPSVVYRRRGYDYGVIRLDMQG